MLEAQTDGAAAARWRASRNRALAAIRDEAEEQARRRRAPRAQRSAQRGCSQAVDEARRADETRARASARAALDTEARRAEQAILRQLMERAWQQLPQALQSRWQDAGSRAALVRGRLRGRARAACAHGPAAASNSIRSGLPDARAGRRVRSCTGDSRPSRRPSPVDGLGAGLRIRAGGACVDATVAGLLASRERIDSGTARRVRAPCAARGAEASA